MVFTIMPVSSAPIQYGHTWGTLDDDYAKIVQTDALGNVYLAGVSGNSYDYKGFVAKLDPLGNILWDRYLEAPGCTLVVVDMIVADSGDLYLYGYRQTYSTDDSFYAKMTNDGTMVYCKVLPDIYYVTRMAVDRSSGGVILISEGSTNWTADGYVIAVNDDGSIRWVQEEPGGDWAWPWGVCTDPAGNSYVLCDRGGNDIGIVKFDAYGNVVRQRILVTFSPDEYSWDVILGSDGYLYAIGSVWSEGLMMLVKFTTSLDVVWCERIGNPMIIQVATELVEAADGSLYSVGLVNSSSSVNGPAIFKYDKSGNVLDATYYAGQNSTLIMRFTDAAAHPSGGIVVGGVSYGSPATTAYPVPGVSVTQVTDPWQDDTVAWVPKRISTVDQTVILGDPVATVDDFSTSSGLQAWFGFVETKPQTLVVEVAMRQHGERVAFKGLVSNGTSPYTYNWDFGDGTTATGQKVTHTYTSGGLFNARLMVTDSAGEFGFDSVEIIVAGPPQILGLSVWPSPAYVNMQVTVSARAVDYAGSIAGYSWNFGDGSSASTTNGTTTHYYSSEGWYNLTVTVTDDSGDTASASTLVQVVYLYDNPPEAAFYYWPDYPIAGQTVHFDGGPSYDSDGYIIEYSWDFGNGMYSNEYAPSTVYSEPGTYMVTLTVYDNYWVSDNASAFVYVQVPPPVPADRYEPDDVWSNASSIAVGGMQVHTISSGGADVDWVTFHLNESADVILETSGVAGDTVMYLYDLVGVPSTVIAMDDDGGQGNWSKMTLNLTAGQYWIKIVESGQDDEINSYAIQVSFAGSGLGWTFMVYMDADNNLEDAAIDDFLEMSAVGSTSMMNVVVQFDRIGYTSEYGGWTSTKRFHVTSGMTPTASNALTDMGELNMGSQDTLIDFVTWSISNYPADNYMLLMWDHGGGWDGAVCWDDTDMDVLSLEELETALNMSSTSTGERIDSIAFDACLMAMAEVTYSVREWTDVLVYSEEVMWTIGLPYDTILADLAADPTMGPATFANCIVSRYMEYYGWEGIETISAVDVGATAPLFAAIDNLGTQLTDNLDYYRYEVEYARNATTFYYDWNYVDLYDLADQVSIYLPNATLQSALDDVRAGVANAVFAEAHGSSAGRSHGLSIYFPMWGYLSSYDALDWSRELSWAGFLRAFNGVVPAEPDAYEPDDTYIDARPISLGEMQTHSINNGGLDVDWVTFTLYNMTTVTMRTSAPSYMWADTVLYLYDSNGVPDSWIAYDDDGWGNGWSVIQIDLSPGTYYAMVESYVHESEIVEYYLELVEGSANQRPVITGLSYDPGLPGPYESIYFYVYAYDPDGYIVEYEWDFGDGNASWTWYNYAYHYYTTGGLFNVSVTVVDNLGGRATANVLVPVSMPPVAVITASTEIGTAGVPVTFSGTESYDPDGMIVAYYWWFSDGGNLSGSEVTHTFLSVGTYQVNLMVMDDVGQWGSASISFTVVNPIPPLAIVAYSPSRPYVGETVTFNGSYSVDPDGVIPTFIWQFGDGAAATGMVVTHEYSYAGDYVAKLTVIDASGLTDDDAADIVVVSRPVAAFEISPSALAAGQLVTFYAYGSFDETGIRDYTWSFGDGTYAQGWQVQHSYRSVGDYQVTLTVTNADGLTADITKTVTVSQALGPQSAGNPDGDSDGLTAAPLVALSQTQAAILMCAALAGVVIGVGMYRRRLGPP